MIRHDTNQHGKRNLRRLWAIGICIFVSFLLQVIIALTVSPFVSWSWHAGSLHPGMVVLADKNKLWLVENAGGLGVLEWYPQIQEVLPFGLLFPPDTSGLQWIKLGVQHTIVYLGSSEHTDVIGVPMKAPGWSIMPDHDKRGESRPIRVVEQAVGWPVPSMYGRVRYRLGDVADPVHGFPWEEPRYEWAVRIPRLGTNYNGDPIPVLQDPILPLRPILSGTALNTGFFALLFYAAWIVVFRFWRLLTGARARERFARGECTRCGYSLGELHKCPECGLVRRRKNLKGKSGSEPRA